MKILTATGFSLVVLAVLYFLLGLATFALQSVSATITEVNEIVYRRAGYPADMGGARVFYGGDETWSSVRYEYKVDDLTYESGLIGLYLPINLKKKRGVGMEVTAYYSPFLPSFGILERGPSMLLFLCILTAGLCLLAFNWWLRSMIRGDA